MAIAFRTVGTKDQAAGATTCVIPAPASIANNDLLFTCLLSDAGSVITTLSGWTLVKSTNVGGSNNKLDTYRKVASGESGNYTWTATTGLIYEGACLRYDGEDTTTPEDVAASTNSATTGTSATANTVTTVTNGAMNLATYATWSAGTLTPPSGGSPAWSTDVNFGSGGDLMAVAHRTFATAGATGNAAATLNISGAWAAQQWAIRPAGAAAVSDVPRAHVPMHLLAR